MPLTPVGTTTPVMTSVPVGGNGFQTVVPISAPLAPPLTSGQTAPPLGVTSNPMTPPPSGPPGNNVLNSSINPFNPINPNPSNSTPLNPQALPPVQANLISPINPPAVNPQSQLNPNSPVSVTQISQTQSNIQNQILNNNVSLNKPNLSNNTLLTANQVLTNTPSMVNPSTLVANQTSSSVNNINTNSLLSTSPTQGLFNSSSTGSNNSTMTSSTPQNSAVLSNTPNTLPANSTLNTTQSMTNNSPAPNLTINPYSNLVNQYAFLSGSPTQGTMNYSFTKSTSNNNLNSRSGFLRGSPLR
jgi:hypothetical protein